MENMFPEWMEDGLADWDEDSIIEKLKSFGIEIDRDKFLVLIEKYFSSQELAESELYPQTSFSEYDKEEDFVWMASEELWKRLRPDKKSWEMITDEIERPFKEAEQLVWERYKNKILELEEKGFTLLLGYFFDDNGQPKKDFFNELKPHFFNIEYYLCVFQDHLAYTGKWEQRLEVSKKVFSLDPENTDFKGLYAEALLYWGYTQDGEKLYTELINDFPGEIWNAVQCADMFFLGYEGMKLNNDFEKAEKYYLIAEKRFTGKIDWKDRRSILQRLCDLYAQWGNSRKAEEYREKRKQLERYCSEDSGRFNDSKYTDALPIYPKDQYSQSQKTGRNEPCPCGSGKKYKKCCGK